MFVREHLQKIQDDEMPPRNRFRALMASYSSGEGQRSRGEGLSAGEAAREGGLPMDTAGASSTPAGFRFSAVEKRRSEVAGWSY